MPSGFYRKLFNILFFSFFKPIHPFSPQKQIQENAGTDAPGQRVCPEYHTDIQNKMNTDGNITYPGQLKELFYLPAVHYCSSGRLFFSPKDCIAQSYESDNEDTYLDQIRICNIHWHPLRLISSPSGNDHRIKHHHIDQAHVHDNNIFLHTDHICRHAHTGLPIRLQGIQQISSNRKIRLRCRLRGLS